MDLSDYLDSRYSVDRAMVKEVAQQTDQGLRTLVETNLRISGWPYTLTNGERRETGDFSQSTGAMILHAVAVAYGVISKSVLVPAVRPGTLRTSDGEKRDPAEVLSLLSNGTSALIDELSARGRVLTRSTTWGVNSPLTLTWVYELLNADGVVDRSKSQAKRAILRRIKDLAGHRADRLIKDPAELVLELESSDGHPVKHPFVLLRTLQLVQAVGTERWSDLQLGKLPLAFLNQLHTELSNSAIRDSGFDPACLVFALEGLLIINPEAITESVLQQVVDVLGSAAGLATHWQPVRPLVANKQGFTLLPQSVEVANSYLRICGLEHDRRTTEEPLFTRSITALQSYADWLLSTALSVRVKIGDRKVEFQGWQSEHTYKPNIVHLWATSQVVLFLQYYSAMLQQHIAHASRTAIKLDYRPQSTSVSLKDSLKEWDKSKKQEPLLGLPDDSIFRAYNEVDRLFVEPRVKSHSATSPPKYSILLYGPPGTGKTSFAETLAGALRFDLIIVSPSDFIRGGEAGVEDRAKRIFDVLLEQSNCVILFDEIDRLLLDRESEEYLAQGDIFQFMTPSMLTKINDLRKQERSVFIIATNYAERIDSAIKRPGRIDEQIALLPPDLEQRIKIIGDRAEKAKLALRDTRIDDIATRTPLYAYSELKDIIQSITDGKKRGSPLKGAVTEAFRQHGSHTISLESYRPRFDPRWFIEDIDDDPKDPKDFGRGPWKEFALLVYLQAQADTEDVPDWARSVLNHRKALDQLDDEISSPLKEYIDQKD